ncbi:MAG: hypothetical protein CMD88_03505 [Gammaproteobacteria bacterium]|nr:hypothetical protein [Gammaproteobacteria bacterium]|tara:strand:+ start:436 stop:690 length:255 start_codon:yes stop_codon:yes gene_type:complete
MIGDSYLELFFYAYTVTSQVMFPILAIIIILLIRDFNRYGDISKKIEKKLYDLSDLVSEKNFNKKPNESYLKHIERFLSKKKNN